MKLHLNSDDFIHLKEKSQYNCNYYKHKTKENIIIEEQCHEDYDFNSYNLVDENLNETFFLGCCYCFNAEGLGKENIELDFMEFYT